MAKSLGIYPRDSNLPQALQRMILQIEEGFREISSHALESVLVELGTIAKEERMAVISDILVNLATSWYSGAFLAKLRERNLLLFTDDEPYFVSLTNWLLNEANIVAAKGQKVRQEEKEEEAQAQAVQAAQEKWEDIVVHYLIQHPEMVKEHAEQIEGQVWEFMNAAVQRGRDIFVNGHLLVENINSQNITEEHVYEKLGYYLFKSAASFVDIFETTSHNGEAALVPGLDWITRLRTIVASGVIQQQIKVNQALLATLKNVVDYVYYNVPAIILVFQLHYSLRDLLQYYRDDERSLRHIRDLGMYLIQRMKERYEQICRPIVITATSAAAASSAVAHGVASAASSASASAAGSTVHDGAVGKSVDITIGTSASGPANGANMLPDLSTNVLANTTFTTPAAREQEIQKILRMFYNIIQAQQEGLKIVIHHEQHGAQGDSVLAPSVSSPQQVDLTTLLSFAPAASAVAAKCAAGDDSTFAIMPKLRRWLSITDQQYLDKVILQAIRAVIKDFAYMEQGALQYCLTKVIKALEAQYGTDEARREYIREVASAALVHVVEAKAVPSENGCLLCLVPQREKVIIAKQKARLAVMGNWRDILVERHKEQSGDSQGGAAISLPVDVNGISIIRRELREILDDMRQRFCSTITDVMIYNWEAQIETRVFKFKIEGNKRENKGIEQLGVELEQFVTGAKTAGQQQRYELTIVGGPWGDMDAAEIRKAGCYERFMQLYGAMVIIIGKMPGNTEVRRAFCKQSSRR